MMPQLPKNFQNGGCLLTNISFFTFELIIWLRSNAKYFKSPRKIHKYIPNWNWEDYQFIIPVPPPRPQLIFSLEEGTNIFKKLLWVKVDQSGKTQIGASPKNLHFRKSACIARSKFLCSSKRDKNKSINERMYQWKAYKILQENIEQSLPW